jgi:hypothetical protein
VRSTEDRENGGVPEVHQAVPASHLRTVALGVPALLEIAMQLSSIRWEQGTRAMAPCAHLVPGAAHKPGAVKCLALLICTPGLVAEVVEQHQPLEVEVEEGQLE